MAQEDVDISNLDKMKAEMVDDPSEITEAVAVD